MNNDKVLTELGRAILPAMTKLGILNEDAVKEGAAEELISMGVIEDAQWRDYKIKLAYDILLGGGMKSRPAIMLLADKFRIGDKSIERIIYGNKKKEPAQT